MEPRESRARKNEQLAGLAALARLLAHDLRAPLNTLRLQCSILKRRTDPADPQIAAMEAEIARLERLIREYEVASESAPMRLNLEPLVPAEILSEIISDLRIELAERDISLTLAPNPTSSRVLGDRDRLRQLVQCLLLSGADGLSSGGELEVAVVDCDSCVCLELIQRGPSTVEPTRMFRPFSGAAVEDGGLRLAIAHDIVRAHCAHISAAELGPEGIAITVLLQRAP